MDKLTYLAELAEGLARWVPERERQDILRYYAEYFEEAGPDREAEVVAELGDPWALSSRLAVEGGYATQFQADSWTSDKKKKWPWILAITSVAAVAVVFVVMAIAWSAMNIVKTVVREETVTPATPVLIEEDPRYTGGDAEYTQSVRPETTSGQGDGGFWSTADGCLEAFQKIDIDASVANVTVTEGEDYTLSISSNTTLGGYSLRWEVKDGALKIRDGGAAGHVNIHSWDDFKNTFGIDASAMDVVVTVPGGVQMKELKAKTGLGDVFISNLGVEKELEVETGLGDIECYEVKAWDEVKLETGLGDVTLGVEAPYSGVEYDLKTGMGTIEAQINGLEKDWEYEAKTGMGTVNVNGDSRGTKTERKGGPYDLEAETGMGDINLYFQDGGW